MGTDDFIDTYIVSPISFTCCLFMILSILSLRRLETNAVIFSYFKLESFFILIDNLIGAILPLYKCLGCFTPVITIYAQCMLDDLLYNMVTLAVETSSILMAIFASLSCLLMLENSSAWRTRFFKLKPHLCALLVLVLSFLISSYVLFMVDFTPNYSNSSDPDVPCQFYPMYGFLTRLMFSSLFHSGLVMDFWF